MTTTLYFDKDAQDVYVKPAGRYESFVPTIDVQPNTKYWLVVVGHTTYDSEREDSEIRYEILDAYVSADEAHSVAEAIHDHAKVWQQTEQLKVPLANGQFYPDPANPLHYLPWTGWGNRYHFTKVVRFVVDEPRITTYGND